GEVCSAMAAGNLADGLPGAILVTNPAARVAVDQFGGEDDRIRILASRASEPAAAAADNSPGEWQLTGYVRQDGQWKQTAIMLVPIREKLFSRSRGLLETSVIADKCVFVPGLGSVGSMVAWELAKLGIMNFSLMDYERVEVANVVRHLARIADIGRRKTEVVAEAIREKNPLARVQTSELRIGWDTVESVRQFVRRADLVIGGADEDDARIILNRICVEENKPLLLPGVMPRACGGQVLLVIPRVTPCYQCFLQSLPPEARQREISSARPGDHHAYSDRPVVPEPGLSNDIAPISQMTVKLAIQQLLAGKPSALHTLDEDLVAPHYMFANRREGAYAGLEPMKFYTGGMRIMRWYGVRRERLPECPCCGEPQYERVLREGIPVEQRQTISDLGI
ncbi:MAG: ThiF family adenylyltransferase, partial [Tepidisphaeraceae bacterium]